VPVVKRAALLLAYNEVRDDARFISTVARTPFDLTGMRLGKCDKPLIHNHKLLETLYYGGPDLQRPGEKLAKEDAQDDLSPDGAPRSRVAVTSRSGAPAAAAEDGPESPGPGDGSASRAAE
jgi:hypothetical protein